MGSGFHSRPHLQLEDLLQISKSLFLLVLMDKNCGAKVCFKKRFLWTRRQKVQTAGIGVTCWRQPPFFDQKPTEHKVKLKDTFLGDSRRDLAVIAVTPSPPLCQKCSAPQERLADTSIVSRSKMTFMVTTVTSVFFRCTEKRNSSFMYSFITCC